MTPLFQSKDEFVIHAVIITLFFILPAKVLPWFILALYLYGIYYNTNIKAPADKEAALEIAEKEVEEKKRNHTPWWIVLGAHQNATLKECKKLRNLLSKIYHPDAGAMPNAETMARINDAYAERETIGRIN